MIWSIFQIFDSISFHWIQLEDEVHCFWSLSPINGSSLYDIVLDRHQLVGSHYGQFIYHLFYLTITHLRNFFLIFSEFFSDSDSLPSRKNLPSWPVPCISAQVNHVTQRWRVELQINNDICTTRKNQNAYNTHTHIYIPGVHPHTHLYTWTTHKYSSHIYKFNTYTMNINWTIWRVLRYMQLYIQLCVEDISVVDGVPTACHQSHHHSDTFLLHIAIKYKDILMSQCHLVQVWVMVQRHSSHII